MQFVGVQMPVMIQRFRDQQPLRRGALAIARDALHEQVAPRI